jgi:hypothetical protein
MGYESSSSFRSDGLCDQRRRRLLTDELARSGDRPRCDAWPEEAAAPRQSSAYGDAEFLQRQWRLLDLVPRRLWAIGLVFVALGAMVAGLEMAYSWMVDRAAAGGMVIVALDLGVKGSLACWLQTLLLLAAAVAAMLVYGVRRHRTDDYQGRYRIWFWAAACWFLMATDQAASLREGFRDAMIVVSGTRLWGDGSVWWVLAYALVLGAVGSRLLLDVWSCRLSTAALLAAAAGCCLAAANQLGWTWVDGGREQIMVRVGCAMGGSLMLLTAMGLHARYVVLDAEGLLPRPAPAADEPEEDDSSVAAPKIVSNGGESRRKIDPPHPTPPPAHPWSASPVAAPVIAAGPAPSLVSAPAAVSRKLTKAERKALKERLIRERMERDKRW